MKAVGEFVAAVLGLVGFVGRTRRRVAIRDDLELLSELRESPDFGQGSLAHQHLAGHIASEVAKFSGAVRRRKKREWGSIVLALFIGVPLSYWTYTIVDDGFNWYAVLPGSLGGLMVVAALGMLTGEEVASEAPKTGQASPTASP